MSKILFLRVSCIIWDELGLGNKILTLKPKSKAQAQA